MKNGYFIGGMSENRLNPEKPNGFADHYPYEKWLFHWGYTMVYPIFRHTHIRIRRQVGHSWTISSLHMIGFWMLLDVFGVYCIIVIDVFLGIIVATLAGILAQFSGTARRILKIFEGCFPIQSVQFLVDQHGKMIEKGWKINMPRLSRFEPPQASKAWVNSSFEICRLFFSR